MPIDTYLKSARDNAERITQRCRDACAKGNSAFPLAPPGTEMGSPLNPSISGDPREQVTYFKGWVHTAVRCIAQRIAGQPIHVGRKKTKLRLAKVAPDDITPISHELLDLLNDPTDFLVWQQCCYLFVVNYELTGRAVFYFKFDSGERNELWPLPSHWLTPIHENGRPFARWKVKPDHDPMGFEVDGMLMAHAMNPHPSDIFSPFSTLQATAAPVVADEMIQTAQIKAYENGVNPGLALILGDQSEGSTVYSVGGRPKLEEHQERQLINAIRRRYQGLHRYGEPIILDGLISDIKKLNSSPQEMDFLQSGQITKERIMQSFGVNPIVAGQVEASSRAASAEADRHFCNNTVNPKIQLINQVLSGWARFLYDDPQLCVVIEPCVPNDSEETRANVLAAVQCGSITQNEARQILLGLPPQKGGDVLIGPASIGPMDDADEPQQSEEGTEP